MSKDAIATPPNGAPAPEPRWPVALSLLVVLAIATWVPDRLMLHAWRLSFDHPITGKRHSFEAPIPQEFDPWTSIAGSRLDRQG